MLCAMDTAALCQGSCCFIYCTLCTAECIVLWALLLCAKDTVASYVVCCVLPHVLCHGHCCFKKCMLCVAVCLCCGHCHLMPSALRFIYCMLYIYYRMFSSLGIAALLQGHCCFICHILCTATCFVPRALLLHILYTVYYRMFCAVYMKQCLQDEHATAHM